MTDVAARERGPNAIDPLIGRLAALLRARGVPVSVAEVIDAHRALAVVGVAHRSRALGALRATLVKHAAHDRVFDEVVDQLLAELAGIDLHAVPTTDEVVVAGFDGPADLAAPLPDEAERRRLLGGPEDATDAPRRPTRADSADGGEAVGLDGLELDLAGAEADADRRWHRLLPSLATRAEDVMPSAERREIERAARAFVARHRRDARRWGPSPSGRLDVRATLRNARRTGGVPMVLRRRGRIRQAPRILVLADVSVSVRPTARLALHTADALTRRSRGVRLLVFVDRVVDATAVVRRLPPDGSVSVLLDGGLVDIGASSDYGVALRGVAPLVGSWIRRGTIVVVFGDGRSNGADPGFEVVDAWIRRVREVHWCTPEPPAAWPLGFGEMQGYADRVSAAHRVRSTADVVAALGA
jgi:uncharacterized protein with von Willebrand factor type A (vWA) domain